MDKEALIEYSSQHKDGIFIAILVLLLVLGGWFLYQQSAQSVEDIIQSRISGGERRVGEGTQSNELVTAELVQLILSKRNPDAYAMNRNPFGSPEDQMRTRQQINESYNRAQELFRAGQYEQAVQLFDQVIALDVTETRIDYPTLPSEYKRRAQQENAKKNFDKIYQSAQTDMQEGDRLLAAGNRNEALNVYKRANENLSSIVDSDPNGDVIGKENIQKIKDLQLNVQKKLTDLWGNILIEQINQVVNQSRQVLNGQDFIAMSKSMIQLALVQQELRAADPNATLVNQAKHTELNTLFEQMQKKLKDNYAILVGQAEQAFAEGLSGQDLQRTQEAINSMRQALSLNPTDQALQKKVNEALVQRANLVIQMAQAFYDQQKKLLDSNQFEQFNNQERIRLLGELASLRDLGAVLDSATRTQAADLQNKMTALRLPPVVTDAYEIISVTPSGNNYKVEYIDKTARSQETKAIYLRENRRDRGTGITLKQVDTDGGFVILSKSGYIDSKVPLTKTP